MNPPNRVSPTPANISKPAARSTRKQAKKSQNITVFELALLAEIVSITAETTVTGISVCATVAPEEAVRRALTFVDASRRALFFKEATDNAVTTLQDKVLTMEQSLWQTHLQEFPGEKAYLDNFLDGAAPAAPTVPLKQVLHKIFPEKSGLPTKLKKFNHLLAFAEGKKAELPERKNIGPAHLRRPRPRNFDTLGDPLANQPEKTLRDPEQQMTLRQVRWILEWAAKFKSNNMNRHR
jgi:hypothetical protein